MSDTPVRITIAHCRRMHYCRSGIEKFCANTGIDFKDFCKHGISSDRLQDLDDMYVARLITEAKKGD